MNVDIKTKNISLNQSLRNFCERVIGELEKYGNIFELESANGMRTTVGGWMEIGKTTRHHRKGPYFRAECQIFLPGKTLRAEAEARYLREAVTQVKDEMQRQMKQYKNKTFAQQKRGKREIKKNLNLAPSARIERSKGVRIREEGL